MLDSILRQELPDLRIDNICNQSVKLDTIQPTDVLTYQQPLNYFPNDKNPSIYIPATIQQSMKPKSVYFMKNVDVEFEEDELRQALDKDGIQIKEQEQMTRPGDTATSRKPTMTVKIV